MNESNCRWSSGCWSATSRFQTDLQLFRLSLGKANAAPELTFIASTPQDFDHPNTYYENFCSIPLHFHLRHTSLYVVNNHRQQTTNKSPFVYSPHGNHLTLIGRMCFWSLTKLVVVLLHLLFLK